MSGGEIPNETGEAEAFDEHFQQRCLDYGKAIEEGRHQAAETAAIEMFQMAMMKAATEEPSQETIWSQMAYECEERGNWTAAVEARRKVLELAQAHEKPEFAIKPHLDLAGLYALLGKSEEAREEIGVAVELASKSDIRPLLVMALEGKAKLELSENCAEQARAAVREALAAIPAEKLFDLQKARVLVLLANCEARCGALESAEEVLGAARGLMAPYGDSGFMGGVQWCFARMAEVRAMIHHGRGEHAAAITTYGEVVARERGIAEQPHLQGVGSRCRVGRWSGRRRILRPADDSTKRRLCGAKARRSSARFTCRIENKRKGFE